MPNFIVITTETIITTSVIELATDNEDRAISLSVHQTKDAIEVVRDMKFKVLEKLR